MSQSTHLDGPAMARSIRDVVSSHAGASEQARTLVPEIVDALWSSGLMQFMNPRAAGGHEPAFRELIDTWQELAWQDGSVGWISIANFPATALTAAYLPEAGFREVFGANDNNRSVLGGQFAPLEVLLEVNLGGEAQKHGMSAAELPEIAARVAAEPALALRGLMTVPPAGDREAARRVFSTLRTLRNVAAPSLPELSMGMSDDLDVAIAEGATYVRVGTAIFGERRA